MRLSVLFVAVLCVGCPGDMRAPPSNADLISLGEPQAEAGATDGAGPDYAKPGDGSKPGDKAKPQADQQAPGGPCPCPLGQYCLSNICRGTCTKPTGPCEVTSTCPSTHACVEVKGVLNLYLCIPGAAPGQTCGLSTYCANKHTCASYKSGSYQCLPVCSQKGAACGTGGTCTQDNSDPTCFFCSKP